LLEQSAATPPLAAVAALQALRTAGKVEPGQAVLINGASGGVGTFAVQITKALGAGVTAVSSRNLDQARALGAARVIDYTRENFVESTKSATTAGHATGKIVIAIWPAAPRRCV